VRLGITRSQRTLLFFISALGYVEWLTGPASRIEAEGSPNSANDTITLTEPSSTPVELVIVRDPFTGAPRPQPSFKQVGRPSAAGVFDGQTATPTDGQTVVPDLQVGSPITVGATGSKLELKATIVGGNSVAYLQDGTSMQIVRVGDVLGSRIVRSIDLAGVELDDGSRIDLRPEGRSETPAPQRTPVSVTERFAERLQALLNRAASSMRSASPISSAQPSAPPPQASGRPTDSYVTPGPLPTIVPNVLPVGASPSSPPDGASPYPLPPLRPPI